MLRILHTADWHLGKVLKGFARLDEQRRVMAEIVTVAEQENVDLVIVAGDVFDTTTPSPDAQQLAWSTLLALKQRCSSVVVVSGNHDSADTFEALRPLFDATGITMSGRPRRAAEGGVVDVGDVARVVIVPFLSQRGAVRAAELFDASAAEARGRYADKFRDLMRVLTDGFDGSRVNVIVSHATLTGATLGGGEREAHSIFDYHVPSLVFPPTASYVALGHLHRMQQVPGPCPIWYPGSPIGVDFGDDSAARAVLLIDAEPGRPAVVRTRTLDTPRPLITVKGTLDEVREMEAPDDAMIRVILNEPARAGLVDEVRALHPGVIEVKVERLIPLGVPRRVDRSAKPPSELFAAYLSEQDVADPAVTALFQRLLDEAQPADEGTFAGADGRLF